MRPEQRGTNKPATRFREPLLFVRCWYEPRLKKRYTTVELIVETADWTPSPPALVWVKVQYREAALREDVKAAGGKWDPEKCLWLLPLDRVPQLSLESRIAPA